MTTQITLPKDAEGREIPLNTTALYDENGSRREVDLFKFYPDKDRWAIVFKDSYSHFSPHNLSLTPPDSWEKLLDDMKNAADAANSSLSASCCAWFNGNKGCADCPADEVNDETCGSQFINDIAARIRSLRGEGK